MKTPIHPEDIETSKLFAQEVIDTIESERTRVGDMARCFLATLDDLKQAESERDALQLTTQG